MELKIYSDYEKLSAAVAEEMTNVILSNPSALLCMASGETPRLAAELLTKKLKKEKIDISKNSFAGLDEWLGIPPDNPGSCQYFFRSLILDEVPFPPGNVYLFDALSADPLKECKKMDEFIFNRGSIDIMIVGIGMNGHIGFNE